jgi:hypothetical protein
MRLRELPRLFADDPAPVVLDPSRGRTKTGQLWPPQPMTVPGASRMHLAVPMSTHPTGTKGCSLRTG